MNTTNAFNAFHANLTNVTTAPGFGLVPIAVEGNRIAFGNIGDPISDVGLLVDFEMPACAGCVHLEDTTLPRGVNRIKGIFGRKLAEFLPESDPREVSGKEMQQRMWDHIRSMTVRDVVRTLRDARAVNWAQSGRPSDTIIGTYGFEYLQSLIAKGAGEEGTLDSADGMIASAAILHELSEGSEAREVADRLIQAIWTNAELGEHAAAAALYELASTFLSGDEDVKRLFFMSESRDQWRKEMDRGRYDEPAFIHDLYRLMSREWNAYGTKDWNPGVVSGLYAVHVDYASHDKSQMEAGRSMLRQAWVWTDRLKHKGWELDEDKSLMHYWASVLKTLNAAILRCQMVDNDEAKGYVASSRALYLEAEEIMNSI